MADMLPPAVQKFIADTKEYNDPLNRSADETRKFGKAAEEASIVAKRAMDNSAEAARRLALAEEEVVKSAKKLRDGLINEAQSAEIATKATKAKERADLAVRESALAAANAADKEAAQFRQVARDAALMEASTFIANTRSAGSVKQNRDEIKKLSQTFPELKKEADSALSSATGMFEGLFKDVSAMQVLVVPAIIGALSQLPAIGAAVSGALTIGLGGAFTFIGMKAAAGSAVAKAAITDLKTHTKAAMKEMSIPFQQTWVNLADAAREAFHQIQPSMQNMFTHLAEATSLFLRRTGQAFYQMNPMFDSLGMAFKAVMDELGGKMPSILNNISTGFTAMFDAVSQHPEVIVNLIEDISLLVRGLGDLLGWLTNVQAKFGGFFGALSGGMGIFTNLAKAAGWNMKSNKDFTASQLDVMNAVKNTKLDSDNLVSSLEAQRLTVDELKKAFDRYTGANQSAASAMINAQQAIDDTTKAIKANGHTIDLNTQKGRDNYKQLIATAKAFQDEAVAAKNDGANQKQLDGLMGNLRNTFYKLALQMTGNKKEAKALTDNLLGIAAASAKIPRTIHQDIYQQMHLTADQAYLNKRANFNLNSSGGPIAGFAGGGPVPRFDGGGNVEAPGTGLSDSGLIRVSNNEFIVRAEQAKKHQDLLMEINAGVTSWAKSGSKPRVPQPPKHAQQAHFTANRTSDWAASHAAASMIGAYRRSSESAWMTRGGVGSGHGEVVQHIQHITVMGSLLTERQLDDRIQEANLQRNIRNPTSGLSLQSGRIGG